MAPLIKYILIALAAIIVIILGFAIFVFIDYRKDAYKNYHGILLSFEKLNSYTGCKKYTYSYSSLDNRSIYIASFDSCLAIPNHDTLELFTTVFGHEMYRHQFNDNAFDIFIARFTSPQKIVLDSVVVNMTLDNIDIEE